MRDRRLIPLRSLWGLHCPVRPDGWLPHPLRGPEGIFFPEDFPPGLSNSERLSFSNRQSIDSKFSDLAPFSRAAADTLPFLASFDCRCVSASCVCQVSELWLCSSRGCITWTSSMSSSSSINACFGFSECRGCWGEDTASAVVFLSISRIASLFSTTSNGCMSQLVVFTKVPSSSVTILRRSSFLSNLRRMIVSSGPVGSWKYCDT